MFSSSSDDEVAMSGRHSLTDSQLGASNVDNPPSLQFHSGVVPVSYSHVNRNGVQGCKAGSRHIVSTTFLEQSVYPKRTETFQVLGNSLEENEIRCDRSVTLFRGLETNIRLEFY